jgi:hypothetical protein
MYIGAYGNSTAHLAVGGAAEVVLRDGLVPLTLCSVLATVFRSDFHDLGAVSLRGIGSSRGTGGKV